MTWRLCPDWIAFERRMLISALEVCDEGDRPVLQGLLRELEHPCSDTMEHVHRWVVYVLPNPNREAPGRPPEPPLQLPLFGWQLPDTG